MGSVFSIISVSLGSFARDHHADITFKRGVCGRANRASFMRALVFWPANLIYRREFRRKYGKKLFT